MDSDLVDRSLKVLNGPVMVAVGRDLKGLL